VSRSGEIQMSVDTTCLSPHDRYIGNVSGRLETAPMLRMWLAACAATVRFISESAWPGTADYRFCSTRDSQLIVGFLDRSVFRRPVRWTRVTSCQSLPS
jgi:hypothetical protein